MTNVDQSICFVCRAFDTDPRARTRSGVLSGDPAAVLDGVRAAARTDGATAAYLCVEAGDLAAMVADETERSPDASIEIHVVPVTPRLVLEDDTALLRVLEGRQAVPYARVPASAPLTLRGRPAIVRNVETLAPDVAGTSSEKQAPWPAGVLEGVPAGTCGIAFMGDLFSALGAESCGACVACREATKQIADMLARLAGAGVGAVATAGAENIDLLEELAGALETGSICHVGVGAAALLRLSFDRFAADFQAHAAGAPCPEAQPDV